MKKNGPHVNIRFWPLYRRADGPYDRALARLNFSMPQLVAKLRLIGQAADFGLLRDRNMRLRLH